MHANGRARPDEIVKLKAEFLEVFTSAPLSVGQAAKQIGRSARTIRVWSQEDEDFRKSYDGAKQLQGTLRLGAVEDLMFNRIIKSLGTEDKTTCAAALVIFWLKANGGDKWKFADKWYVEHSGEVDLNLNVVDMDVRVAKYKALLSGTAKPTPVVPETGDAAEVTDE